MAQTQCCQDYFHRIDLKKISEMKLGPRSLESVDAEERDSVEEMLKIVGKDEDPFVALRWLRSTQFNLKEAVKGYKLSKEWCLVKGAQYLVNWRPPEVLRKFYPGGFIGYDKSGCPVWMIPLGRADMKGLLGAATKLDFIDFTLKILETSLRLMRESEERRGKPVYQHIFIFDMQDFSLSDALYSQTLEVVQSLISIYESNYPETLKAAYVINTSKIFQMVFAIIQKTVNQRTLQKIQVFGATGWKETLLSVLTEDNLPVMWGGTKRLNQTCHVDDEKPDICPEAGGVCLGGEIPVYYKTIRKNQDIHGQHSIYGQKIPSNGSYSVQVVVRKRGTLAWRFKVEGGDITFSIRRIRCLQSLTSMETADENIGKSVETTDQEINEFCHDDPSDIQTEDLDMPSDNDKPLGNEPNHVSTHPSGEPVPRKDSSKIALPSIFLSSSNSTNQVTLLGSPAVPISDNSQVDTSDEETSNDGLEPPESSSKMKRAKSLSSSVSSKFSPLTVHNGNKQNKPDNRLLSGSRAGSRRCSVEKSESLPTTVDNSRRASGVSCNGSRVNSIAFSETEIDTSASLETVVPPTKISNPLDIQGGFVAVEHGYIYFLIWDNSDSMIRSRKLNYNYDLQNENGQEEENVSLKVATEESLAEKDITKDMDDIVEFVMELISAEKDNNKGDNGNKNKQKADGIKNSATRESKRVKDGKESKRAKENKTTV